MPSVGRPLKVLVIDDNHDAADALAMAVRLWGHECQCLYEPMHAFEVVVIRQPDVVISDLAMPCVNGFKLAKLIRGHPGLHQPLLVAITGFGDPDHRLEAASVGFDHFVVKGADMRDLRALLADAASIEFVPT